MADHALHSLQSMDWFASVEGTGFVGHCACGWVSGFVKERATGLLAAYLHAAATTPAPEPVRRFRRLRPIGGRALMPARA
jgi:hypothetical protein